MLHLFYDSFISVFIFLGAGGGFFGLFSSDNEKTTKLKKEIGTATMHLHQSEPHLAVENFKAAFEVLFYIIDENLFHLQCYKVKISKFDIV